ncbi:MAG TPA: undecaprenyl-phosphate glucose phosphotransferase [Chitinophagaceae bacterium]|nr:undecaprenyl-phosphate glucose phosphotransferase [Chitinophagaceae bacterium]
MQMMNLSTRGKIIADLIFLALITIVIQGNQYSDTESFISSTNLVGIFTSIACWFFAGRSMGLYNDFRMKSFSIEWVVFLKSLVLYTLLISFVSFQLLDHSSFNRSNLLFHCSLIFICLPVQKLLLRIAFKKIRNSDLVMRKVLIVGAGSVGVEFYDQYVKNKNYGYTLTGFVDEERNTALNGHYLGKTSDIARVIAKHEPDDIVVTLPMTDEMEIQKVVTAGEMEGKRIRIVPNYQHFGTGKLHVDKLGSLPIINLRSLPLDVSDNKIYKRIFDIVFSLLVIVFLLSWLLPIIAIIIKLGSKGPVFFKQVRWGLDKKNITCYKFRTMVSTSMDVDENGKYLQACKDDPRITRIGKFLRKNNLDELPQFFNVLLGSMSVIGPRPHPVPLNLVSKGNIERYMMRHWVKPGISGWAQVNGYRGETKVPYLMSQRVHYDCWYIENWTFWLDLQIVVQTLVNMVKGEKNAV